MCFIASEKKIILLQSFTQWFLKYQKSHCRAQNQTLTRICLLAVKGSQGVLDLTELIGIPLPPFISFVTGSETFPAYSFGPGAMVGRPAQAHLPSPFYYDFAISVTVKPSTQRGGVLFAVTDKLQTVGCEAVSPGVEWQYH